MSLFLAQTRSADRVELRLSLEVKRKTSTRDEHFAFWGGAAYHRNEF
jgi:hypothetical protein